MNNSSIDKTSFKSKHEQLKKSIISSSCGALITSFTMTPLDVVKIRLQAQTRMMHKGDCFVYKNGLMDHLCTCFNGSESWYNRKIPGGRYTGTLDALIKIVRAEGLPSLWSGLPPTLLMALPSVIIYFTSYDEIKRYLGYHEINNPNQLIPAFSGGLARLFSASAISPLELIRTKVQSERIEYRNVFKFIKESIRKDGIRTLYQGWSPTILRDVPFSIIYWMNYELAKMYMIKRQTNKLYLDNTATFLCGAMAGSIAAIITTPFDVVKTQRQMQLGEHQAPNKHSLLTKNIIKDIYRTKGIEGLFAGVTPRVAKVSLSCAIMITTFEYFKRLMNE